MASPRIVLVFLQAVALFGYLSAADIMVKDGDKVTGDDKVEEQSDDLDTQETVWMGSSGIDPFQKKLQEIEYVKTKLLSPFMALKSPTNNYGGGYPVYYGSAGGGFSTGVRYSSPPPNYGARPVYYWTKPVKQVAPSYSQNTWYNKGFSGVKYQHATSSYAPDCDHTSAWRPSSVSVPVTPTYTVGTPLNTYYSSASPSQTYGTPLLSVSAKSSISSSSSQSGSVAPAMQTVTVPLVISENIAVKSSDPQTVGGYKNFNPFSYWTSTGSLPTWSSASGPSSAQSSIPSWSGFSSVYPSSSAQSSVPSWSGFSSSYPSSSSVPQVPAALSPSSSSSGYSGFYPVPVSASQLSSYTTTTPSPPSWSSITSTSQQASQQSSNPLSSYFQQGSQYTNPSSLGQQYFVVPPTPSSAVLSDQGEVRITPAPPVQLKSNYISTVPGPNIALPIDSSVYSPGSSYVGSYYPNVFYITNEQHVDKPDMSDTSDQGRSVLQSSSGNKNTSSESVSSSTESSSILTKTLSPSQMVNTPVPTAFYSSNTADSLKFAVFSIPPPVVSTNGFYSIPVQGSYPIPVSSALLATSSTGSSQSQMLQNQPLTRSSNVNVYPLPLGYRYNPPSVAFQTGFQTQLSAKASPPC